MLYIVQQVIKTDCDATWFYFRVWGCFFCVFFKTFTFIYLFILSDICFLDRYLECMYNYF